MSDPAGGDPGQAVSDAMKQCPVEVGAALGVGGVSGVFVTANMASTQAAIDGVSPGSWRGALRVLAFLAALLGPAVAGRLLVPALGAAWLLIALAVMVPVAGWWTRRRERHQPRPTAP